MTSADDEILISPNPPVFDLSVLVEKHGVALRYSADYSDRKEEHERDVPKRLEESFFVQGKADAYNVCEWGAITASGAERMEPRSRLCGQPWRHVLGA